MIRLITILSCVGFILTMLGCQSGGTVLYFTSDRDGNLEIYSTIPNSGEEINVTNKPEDEYAPSLSPDGKWIAFLVGDKEKSSIDVLNLDSGEDKERFTISKGSGKFSTPVWSPDSKRIAYTGKLSGKGSRIYITSIDDSPARLSDIEVTEVGDWSFDGESVVFSSTDGERTGIHVRNPDGVNQRQMTCGKDYHAIWSPDSKKLAFISERDGNADVYVMDRDAMDDLCSDKNDSRLEAYQLTETDEKESDISWSPDGKRLVFVSERDGNKEIYIMEESGNKQTRLTYNEIPDYDPIWSPDGGTIAFVSELDGDPDIFLMNDKGENQTRVTNNEASDTNPSW